MLKPKRFIFLFLVLILTVSLLTGCRKGEKTSGKVKKRRPDVENPAYVLYNVTHDHYEKGKLKVVIKFDKGMYFAREDLLAIDRCRFTYYDEDGNVTSKGRADRVDFFISKSFMKAWDNIEVYSLKNGARLTTNYLEWYGDSELFKTDDYVNITRKNGDSISGKGMEANISLSVVKILHNVKGKIKN